jgi:tetratricopeptide (TPR) repeat protein
VLAADHHRAHRPAQAIELLRELTRLRRSSADWALIGSCEMARGDSQAALTALEKAVAINPGMSSVQWQLARLYESTGEVEKAVLQRRVARRVEAIAKAVATRSKAGVSATVP